MFLTLPSQCDCEVISSVVTCRKIAALKIIHTLIHLLLLCAKHPPTVTPNLFCQLVLCTRAVRSAIMHKVSRSLATAFFLALLAVSVSARCACSRDAACQVHADSAAHLHCLVLFCCRCLFPPSEFIAHDVILPFSRDRALRSWCCYYLTRCFLISRRLTDIPPGNDSGDNPRTCCRCKCVVAANSTNTTTATSAPPNNAPTASVNSSTEPPSNAELPTRLVPCVHRPGAKVPPRHDQLPATHLQQEKDM
jgi:hypothetical protein